ncbi:MAG TPA: glycine zipper family protein [Acetobacteraceae bacterium]|nr:glycine zipper family protein [Acetobacteraceae bacterium]
MRRRLGVTAFVLGGAVLLAGCAVQPPTGPTVMALPGNGKSLTAFQQDDYACRNYAYQTTMYESPGQAGATPGTAGAVLGTLGGAALGAALGAVGGNAGAGAAIGGGAGLLGGASIGSQRGEASQYSLQQRYNIAYTQCMYSRGDSVQSPPPGYALGYPSYGYPVAAGYPYPYGGPGFYGPGFVSTGVFVVGGGTGWHDHWHGGGWHGGGWHGGHWR